MKKSKKIISIFMVGILSLMPFNTYALTKNESVYTTLTKDGVVKKTLVTNHLTVNDEEEIDDYSELSNILNLNGNEEFIKNENNLKWKVKGEDIFYQGETTKNLPISIKIEYYLNGKKEDAKDIIGKKGEIQIDITFTNNLKNTVKINGKNEELYTPFVVMSAAVLNNKENDDITVTNGKVVDTGSKSAIVSVASPGIYESLKISELNNMNKTTIKYTTSKFSLGNIYILATPKLLEEGDIDFFDEIGSLSSSIGKLQDSINSIEDGAKKLEGGSTSLVNGANEVKNSLNMVISSISELQTGEGNLKVGLNSAISALNEAEVKLSAFDTTSMINQINTVSSSNDASISKLLSSIGMDFNTLYAYVNDQTNSQNSDYLEKTSILNAIVSLKTSNTAFNGIVSNLSSISELTSKITELKNGLIQLENGSIKIYDGLTSLKSGVEKIYNGQESLTNGAKELNLGVNTLQNGISTFNKEGINNLNSYSNKINTYSNRAEALVSLSNNYNGFTSNNAINTIFIGKVSLTD